MVFLRVLFTFLNQGSRNACKHFVVTGTAAGVKRVAFPFALLPRPPQHRKAPRSTSGGHLYPPSSPRRDFARRRRTAAYHSGSKSEQTASASASTFLSKLLYFRLLSPLPSARSPARPPLPIVRYGVCRRSIRLSSRIDLPAHRGDSAFINHPYSA